ncbi:MAG: hypothetical protein SPL05_06800 [Eubacteriales bacterium]|nr:hypothetical protein [Eubacteriales bacterium]
MALTRQFLKSLNLEAETIESVINEHVQVTEALKNEKKELETKYKGFDELQSKVTTLETENKTLKETEQQYVAYKADIEHKAELQRKETKLAQLLKASNANEMVIPLLLKAVNLDDLKLTDKGEFENSPIDSLKAEYSKLFEQPTQTTQGVVTSTPPATPTPSQEDQFLAGFAGK